MGTSLFACWNDAVQLMWTCGVQLVGSHCEVTAGLGQDGGTLLYEFQMPDKYVTW